MSTLEEQMTRALEFAELRQAERDIDMVAMLEEFEDPPAPDVVSEQVTVYRAVGVESNRRYFTRRAAYRSVAWQMVRDRYPEEFDRPALEFILLLPSVEFKALVDRLTRKLLRVRTPGDL